MMPHKNRNFIYKIKKKIKERKISLNYRKRKSILNGDFKIIKYKGKKYLNFSTNNYLGLSRNLKIINYSKKYLIKYGIGSCSSTHIVGYNPLQKKIEKYLAKWFNYSKAILFNSGFDANQSVIETLFNFKNFCIIADKLSHASLLHTALKIKSKLIRFNHNDLIKLDKISKKINLNKLIVTEGIFSMDGDIAPLNKIREISIRNNSLLLIDDAHGFGVVGKEGKGYTEKLKCHPDLLILTFSKALGTSGGAVLCNETIANYLIQFSSKLIYSTSIPTFQLASIYKSIREIKKSVKLRKNLSKNIKIFKKGIENIGINSINKESHIQSIIIGDNKKTIKLTKFLKKNGIWINAICPPTVPINTSRIRITLTSMHSKSDIEILLNILKHAKDKKYFS